MTMLKYKLLKIQTEIKAPKNLYNSFGGFKYRNAEAILETAKPLLREEGLSLVISDEVVEVAGRPYVKAIATLSWIDDKLNETLTATAYARIPDVKKGMDDAQLTGAASSYARKYALNGLFLLDDNKDADTDEYKTTTDRAPEPEPTPEPTAPAAFICEDCGNTITARGKASAENIAASSRAKFGRQLCYNCGHEEKLRREALPFPIDEGGI